MGDCAYHYCDNEPAAGSVLVLEAARAGEDLSLLLYGGERPHIGCTVIAVPRLSLTGEERISCTSSVVNLTGHKDDEICRPAAEKICCALGVTTVCSGGFHLDQISPAQIAEVREAVSALIARFLDTGETWD